MSDEFEDILKEVEAANQSTPAEATTETAPAPAAAAPAAAPTSGSDNSAFDLAKLNEQLRAFGPYEVKTPDDLVNHFGNMHKGLKQAQQEKTKAVEESVLAQARLRRQESFLPQQDPRFMQQRYEAPAEYGDDPVMSSPVGRQLVQQVTEERELRAERDMRDALDRLQGDPDYKGFVTDEVRKEVLLECVARQNYDPEAVFLKKYNRQIVEHVREQTRRELVDSLKTNAAAGAGLMPTTVAAPSAPAPVDPALLSRDDAEKWIDMEARRIAENPKYAAEVVRRNGGTPLP